MEKLTVSGFFDHLASLKQAKIVILFGSFARADWHNESDIDIFMYGKDDEFEQGKYELKLKREIQLHCAENKTQLKTMQKLLPYVLSGEFIKGSSEDLELQIII